jgi:hypothetical protein
LATALNGRVFQVQCQLLVRSSKYIFQAPDLECVHRRNKNCWRHICDKESILNEFQKNAERRKNKVFGVDAKKGGKLAFQFSEMKKGKFVGPPLDSRKEIPDRPEQTFYISASSF